jgi:uncharacterized protein YbjT (DUF2867 family)
MSTIAIAGATGYIGGRIAPRLLEACHRVRCLVRSVLRYAAATWAENLLIEVEKVDLAAPFPFYLGASDEWVTAYVGSRSRR